MEAVTLIAKGPSAEHSEAFIQRCPGTRIAVINDAGTLIPERQIDYCFVTDRAYLPRLEQQTRRTARVMSPEYTDQIPRPEWLTDDKFTTYNGRECCGDEQSLTKRILSGGICHHSTTTGAMHWLAKHTAYNPIRIIGVDGGTAYAAGMGPATEVTYRRIREALGDDFMDDWKRIAERLAGILTNVYGKRFEWYK